MILPTFPIYKEIILPLNTGCYLFKDIVKDRYFVSSYGRLFNSYTGNYLPKNIMYDKDKYINVTMTTIHGTDYHIMLHRLIMYSFNYIENCENLDVNHRDGIKYHNWIWNLEWTTHKENMQHALDNNLFKFGKQRKNTKLLDSQVREICSLIDSGIPLKEIAKTYDAGDVNMKKTIYNIASGHCWSHISKDYKFRQLEEKEESSTTIENKLICPIRFL